MDCEVLFTHSLCALLVSDPSFGDTEASAGERVAEEDAGSDGTEAAGQAHVGACGRTRGPQTHQCALRSRAVHQHHNNLLQTRLHSLGIQYHTPVEYQNEWIPGREWEPWDWRKPGQVSDALDQCLSRKSLMFTEAAFIWAKNNSNIVKYNYSFK